MRLYILRTKLSTVIFVEADQALICDVRKYLNRRWPFY